MMVLILEDYLLKKIPLIVVYLEVHLQDLWLRWTMVQFIVLVLIGLGDWLIMNMVLKNMSIFFINSLI